LLSSFIPKDYAVRKQILPIQLTPDFELSNEDKTSILPLPIRLAFRFDNPEQAYAFLKPGSSRRLVLYLPVDAIRINLIPATLDVWWFLLTEILGGGVVPNKQAGARGHAGLVGLDHENKLTRKSLREFLARLASLNAPYHLDGLAF
jgi:hypothetical protein